MRKGQRNCATALMQSIAALTDVILHHETAGARKQQGMNGTAWKMKPVRAS